jgi:cell division protein FtsA
VQNLTKCVQRAGVEIDELVLAPLATAEAVLTDEDRELGVALLDIGGDTTDLAVFHDGSIAHAATIPMGGKSITSDLGIVLRVTPEVAESLKLRQGSALPVDVDPDEVVQITSIGEEVAHGVTRRTSRRWPPQAPRIACRPVSCSPGAAPCSTGSTAPPGTSSG